MKNIDAFFLTLSLLCCSFAVSCRQGDKDGYVFPKFEKEFAQEFEPVGPELDFNSAYSIHPYGDYLLLGAYDARTLKYLHVMDKKTGEIIQSAVREGRGPGELITRPVVSLVGSECYLYDANAKVTQIYDLDRILQGENGYVGTLLEPVDLFVLGVYHGSEDRAVCFSNASSRQVDSSRVSPRIVLEKGTERYEYDEYPIPDRVRTWWMYNTAYLTISPDFTKMAVVPAFGAILERFDLSDGISLMGADRFIEPDFTLNGTNPDFVNHAIPFGFSGFASSSDRIFAGMVAEAVSGQGTRNLEFPISPMLAVFGWDGRPLMRIRTSVQIDNLAYDETEGVLYAVYRDEDRISHIGKMKIQL